MDLFQPSVPAGGQKSCLSRKKNSVGVRVGTLGMLSLGALNAAYSREARSLE